MENLSIPTLRELYKHYVKWVSTHPERTTDLEASIKWISYFLAGRINNSTLLSELIYSMSNFMMLFNDQIILSSAKNSASVNGKEKKNMFCPGNIKRFLTMVDYIEVFIEVSATRIWGTKGRWIIIVLLQSIKCLARLYLLHVHKLHMLESPPVQPLDRKTVGIKQKDDGVDSVITLPSGRTVRKMEYAPPMNRRTWEAPPRADRLVGGGSGRAVSDRHVVAETMYIMKPIVHLGSICVFGEQSWKPWFISLTIEYISLQRLKSSKNLTPQQRLVMSKRALNLAMYIVRSPFFDNYSEKHIRAFLHWFVNSVPLVGPLMRPFLEYLQQWQETYFYLWST